MTEPRRPRDLDETLLDEGRVRRFPPPVARHDAALAETLLDEGRRRRQADARTGAAAWPEIGDALPDRLAERYEPIRRLDVPASQADLLLVRVRETGEPAVLKHYLTGRDPHPDLVSYLSTPRDHVARHLEFGPGYEVTEYLPGGSLLDRRERDPAWFDLATLPEIAQQVSAVLVGLHRQGLVHRDIKPANLVLRSTEPLDLAVIDFGIAGPLGDAYPIERPNPAYQPPEAILLGEVGVAGDWWSLGITLVELATGGYPLDGLTPEELREHFAKTRGIDVAGVPEDPRPSPAGRRDRLRNLCQGLLVSDPALRWGEREVSDWLVGNDPEPVGVVPRPPPAPTASAPTTPTEPADASQPEPVAAAYPYVFAGASYHYRDDLAQALATAWNHAAESLFSQNGELDGLRDWLEHFTDADGLAARRVVEEQAGEETESRHVRLLRLVRALDPTRPAVYRNHVISRRHLLAVAHQAAQNAGDAGSVLSDLWTYRLLPTFDAAVPVEAEAGGEAFADLDQDWRSQRRRWDAGAAQIHDAGARQHLARSVPEPEVLAVTLRAALRQPADLAAAHDLVHRTVAELPVPVPWYSTLARQPQLVWVALLTSAYARTRARSAADRELARAAEAEALRASAVFREWSRRQNRPAALGWAVAGVSLMAAGWIALIAASDAAGRAGDTAIAVAWVGAAVCAAVSLVVECLLAVEVGGRFHPRYSIPGAGGIALGPLGRWMQRAWLPAGLATLAGLAGIAVVALRFPQAIAASTTAGHLLWVLHRWRAWRSQVAGEDALIAQARQRRGPSDTDGVSIGTTTGAQT